jgi:hypothetical protein
MFLSGTNMAATCNMHASITLMYRRIFSIILVEHEKIVSHNILSLYLSSRFFLLQNPRAEIILTPYLILLSINYTEIRNVNNIFSAFEYHSNRINKSQPKPSEMIPTLDRHWYTC